MFPDPPTCEGAEVIVPQRVDLMKERKATRSIEPASGNSSAVNATCAMLDRLALASEDRAKVDAQLDIRIPPLSNEDRAQRRREKAILMSNFARPEARIGPDTTIVRVPLSCP